jgi:hypothetical protein
MAGKAKTWIWVVVGVVAFGILGVIAMAAAGLWFAKTHINIRPETSAAALEDFQHARAAFAGQKPLIELDDRGHFVHANTDRPAGTERPQSLTVMAFDPGDERIVRMDIPFWMLRLKMRGTRIGVGSGGLNLRDLNLTVEDLERFGPTLIVDHTGPKGERVLVWSR